MTRPDVVEPFLRRMWYVVAAGRDVRPGRLLGRTVLGEPIVLGRRRDGTAFALRDVCPHRGMPLRHGQLEGGCVRCSFHGWTFDAADGRCTEIPALTERQAIDLSKISVRKYECREADGNVWLFVPVAAEAPPPVPVVAGARGLEPQITESCRVPCRFEPLILGLVDPAHLNYVHTNRWWKPGRRPQREKEKRFEPTTLGFRMVRHQVPAVSRRLFRVLGRNVSNEITFELPGTRVDHFEGDAHRLVICFTVTPVDASTSDIHFRAYWSNRWFDVLRPVARRVARRFIAEDVAVSIRQAEGLRFDPPAMYINDADTQIKWYFKLVQAYARAAAEGRPFENPLEPATLRWRS